MTNWKLCKTTPKTSEFNIGETVTYAPYDKELTCEVKDVRVGMWGDGKYFDGEPDDRVFYKLEGSGVQSICTGECIKESVFFKPESIQ